MELYSLFPAREYNLACREYSEYVGVRAGGIAGRSVFSRGDVEEGSGYRIMIVDWD